MKVYLDELSEILANGSVKGSRTGTQTLSVFGRLTRFDISNNKLPLLTTKKMFTRSFIHETIWFLSGSHDIAYLKENNVSIWDSWVTPDTARYDEDGNLIGGSIGTGSYGPMWRNEHDVRLVKREEIPHFEGKGFKYRGDVFSGEVVMDRHIDRIADVINELKNNPDGRRIIVDTYSSRQKDFAALPPCHSLFQFYSKEEDGVRKLSVLIYLRSSDAPVGRPFNIGNYALLCMLIAHVTGHVTDELVVVRGDDHIYLDQVDLVKEQIEREPYEQTVTVKLNPEVTNIDDFKFEDITVEGYEKFHPSIKYPVGV